MKLFITLLTLLPSQEPTLSTAYNPKPSQSPLLSSASTSLLIPPNLTPPLLPIYQSALILILTLNSFFIYLLIKLYPQLLIQFLRQLYHEHLWQIYRKFCHYWNQIHQKRIVEMIQRHPLQLQHQHHCLPHHYSYPAELNTTTSTNISICTDIDPYIEFIFHIFIDKTLPPTSNSISSSTLPWTPLTNLSKILPLLEPNSSKTYCWNDSTSPLTTSASTSLSTSPLLYLPTLEITLLLTSQSALLSISVLTPSLTYLWI